VKHWDVDLVCWAGVFFMLGVMCAMLAATVNSQDWFFSFLTLMFLGMSGWLVGFAMTGKEGETLLINNI